MQQFPPATSRDFRDSGILLIVPSKTIGSILVCFLAAARLFAFQAPTAPSSPPVTQTAPQTPAAGTPQTPAGAPGQTAPPPATPPHKTLAVVIVDPAHGGADSGARGSSGIAESDVSLSFARLLRISLEAQGLRVIMTRQANDGPSFDDRSKLANAQREGIFISLHVSSAGQPGTVRVYSLPQMPPPPGSASAPRGGLLPWDRAQFRYIDQSRRLAELIQIQMAQHFRGSPETPLEAPVRQLRTVGLPAVAIEVSSVSIPTRGPLDQMGPALADGVARAVAAYRTVYEAGSR